MRNLSRIRKIACSFNPLFPAMIRNLKDLLSRTFCFSTILVALAVVGFSERASADGMTFSGTISGVFSEPVRAGFFIDANGNKLFQDNTATASFTGFLTSSITWGSDVGFGPNMLSFTGATFSNVVPGQIFELGTITYHNSSTANDLFGATLTLSLANVDPAVSHLTFTPTENTGVSEKVDADFIAFDVFPVTFNVFEQATASAILFGKIVGDPQLEFTSIELAPGQGDNGFIGHGQPSVPDTGTTIILLLSAVSGLGIARRFARP
jgi:hypothetical protein